MSINPRDFHPAVYVLEEMQARGWSRDTLASLMCRSRAEYGVTRLSLDFFFDLAPDDPRFYIGDEMAAQFEQAFGVSKELFLNLERSWLAHVESAKSVENASVSAAVGTSESPQDSKA